MAFNYLWWRCRELMHQTHQLIDITGIITFDSIRDISTLCKPFVPYLSLSVNTKRMVSHHLQFIHITIRRMTSLGV